MSYAAGTISQTAVGPTTASLAVTAASSATTPLTNQWYRSTTTGFSPGAGTVLSGKTAATVNDSGLVPGTTYYYKNIQIDSAATPNTATASQLAVTTTAPVQAPNAFAMAEQLGVVDLRFAYNTVSVEIDQSESGTLYAGSAVKMYDSAGGIPKVVKCAANTEEVLGFINYDIKSQSFIAGSKAEISMSGNVMYLYATGAIARGAQVSLDLVTNGGVRSAAGNTGDKIVGWAYDKASAAGDLIRVFLKTPSFTVV